MASTAIEKQSSFSAGEVSPECYGRTDIPSYKQALRLCRNFLPMKHGALKNRAGTKFVATTKNPTGTPPRLIPFVFSDGQTFVLEFGDKYFRVYSNGGAVLNANVVVEVVTPWAIADVPRLKYAQSGDIITICHPSYPPQDVERLSNTSWTVTASLLAPPRWPLQPVLCVSIPNNPFIIGYWTAAHHYTQFDSVGFVESNLGINPGRTISVYQCQVAHVADATNAPDAQFNGQYYWQLISYSGTYTYQLGQYAWAPDVYVTASGTPISLLFMSISAQNFGNAPAVDNGSHWLQAGSSQQFSTSLPAGPASLHPAQIGSWAFTALLKDARGVITETLPSYYTPPGGYFPRYPDRPVAFTFSPYVATAGAPALVGYNVYFGSNGVYGSIDSIGMGADGTVPTSWTDTGGAPDFNTEPPAGTNPFLLNPGAAVPQYSWPGVVAYFQQRRIFGRSNAFPNSFWGSAIGNFSDFDQPDFVVDSNSFQFLIAATKLEEIRSIVPQRELLIYTSSSETVASGSNGGVGGAITPSSIDVRPASHHGASYLDPVVADHSILEVTAKGCYVRDLQYDFRSASYTGRDITSLVRHLLDGHTIVDWFFAETPDNVIWIVRDDGVLLTLTYEADFQVVAFAQHSSNQAILGAQAGVFKAVCSVPEGTEDAVYFVVQRTLDGQPTNCIERLSSRFIDGPNGPTDYRQCCFLDCAYSFNGRNSAAPNDSVMVVTLPAAAPAPQRFIVTLNNTFPFTATDAALNNQVVIHPDGIPLSGVDDQPGTPLPPVRLRIVTFTAANSVICELDTPAPANWGLFNNTSDWAIARTQFTALSALEGCAVGALVDGQADLGRGGDVVIGGTITVTKPGVDVTIGLPYFSDLQTLDTAGDGYKVNERQVQQAAIEVVNSRAFSVGENFDNLNALKARKVTDGYGLSPLLSGPQPLSMANSWNLSGAICLRMKDPLPLTVVSIVRVLAVGGR